MNDERFPDHVEIRHRATGEVLYAGPPFLAERDLREADLRGARLATLNLGWADLRGADLRGADLRGVGLQLPWLPRNLQGAKLEGALYDGQTRWPARFDPARAGCIRAEPPSDDMLPEGDQTSGPLGTWNETSAPVPCASLAALEREVRQAAGRTGWVRGTTFGTVLVGVTGGLLWLCALEGAGRSLSGPGAVVTPAFLWTSLAGAMAAFGALTGSMFAVPLAASYRARRALQLRNRVTALPPEEQAVALAALRDVSGSPDVRALLEPLIQELTVRQTEVVPATAPAGDTREVAVPAPSPDRLPAPEGRRDAD